MTDFDVVIIGGGLAGLTAAIDMSKRECKVLVLEKNDYPQHKVCGEYVSNEVLPYLKSLGVTFDERYPKISKFKLCAANGKSVYSELPLGGFGISRYSLDYLLFQKAQKNGVVFEFQSVQQVHFKINSFQIKTKTHSFTAKLVLGCYGKRSNLDMSLKRKFIQTKSPWLGVKAHYHNTNFDKELVALGTFKGGYGGLSKVENEKVNFCYLVNYKSFQKIGSIQKFNDMVVSQNPMLGDFLKQSELANDFKKPISISQISFAKKQPVENHMLMCGDSAGLIHPLCGNGMAMAITSARIAANVVVDFFENWLNRKEMEERYARAWRKQFSNRLWAGRRLQYALMRPQILNASLKLVGNNSKLIQNLITKTHGNQQMT